MHSIMGLLITLYRGWPDVAGSRSVFEDNYVPATHLKPADIGGTQSQFAFALYHEQTFRKPLAEGS